MFPCGCLDVFLVLNVFSVPRDSLVVVAMLFYVLYVFSLPRDSLVVVAMFFYVLYVFSADRKIRLAAAKGVAKAE